MQSAGIDIGSRTIEYVVREAGRTAFATRTDTTFDPLSKVRAILATHPCERPLATGYGRTLLELSAQVQTVTEIKAYGRGVRFEMNDRCAAGTGKFLEVRAAAPQYPLDGFGGAALGAALLMEEHV